MNRTLALSLTLAILLAHMLAIHKGMAGSFAPPYDEAHVTFRVARNLVDSGSLAWDQGGKPIECFPSFLWLVLGSIGTRLTPGMTFAGMKMPGQMGNARVTVQNLRVVKIDLERGLLFVQGGVPGADGGDVVVRKTVKQK